MRATISTGASIDQSSRAPSGVRVITASTRFKTSATTAPCVHRAGRRAGAGEFAIDMAPHRHGDLVDFVCDAFLALFAKSLDISRQNLQGRPQAMSEIPGARPGPFDLGFARLEQGVHFVGERKHFIGKRPSETACLSFTNCREPSAHRAEGTQTDDDLRIGRRHQEDANDCQIRKKVGRKSACGGFDFGGIERHDGLHGAAAQASWERYVTHEGDQIRAVWTRETKLMHGAVGRNVSGDDELGIP